eukprot:TRINITY_DN13818_c0_g1_i6.p1 TRINITY_DN13818_c0_g1~~TRINITY_DN13818_c0_g1_i6.p1  ORF type:complete len:159 (-),score=43.11 TRINITY_DN13818_c0_g1_i6:84-560(-)
MPSLVGSEMCIRDRATQSNNTSDIDSEVRRKYKELSQQIREKYNPHFNLYQKIFLSQKLGCYEKHKENPEEYYMCIEQIDHKMQLHSQDLKKKFGAIELEDEECQNKCKKVYENQANNMNSCINKCFIKMKERTNIVYDQFYEEIIGKHSLYSKLKKQ